MDGVREFLESSTIHGLAYLAKSKPVVRVIWLGVVLTGFSVAAVLIQQSFSSWAKSPITTTIETRPITEIDFPNVTVCPPRNSFTSLTPDLVKSRNINFDVEKRKTLSDDVVRAVYDASFHKKYQEFVDLRQDQYIDWYTGISSSKNVPGERNINYNKYSVETTRLDGQFSTPYFRQSLDEHKFQIAIIFKVHIYVPPNLSNNNSIIINIDMDIGEEVFGSIYMQFEIFFSDNIMEVAAREEFFQNKRDFQREYKIDEISAHRNK